MEAIILLFFFVIYVLFRVLFAEKSSEERDNLRFSEGVVMLQNKNWVGAEKYFASTVVTHPKSAMAWTSLGICHFYQSEMLMAQVCFEKAIALDNLALTFFFRGKIAYQEHNFKQALIEFNKAIWYKRKDAVAYRWKANTLLALGEQEQAIKCFRDAVKLGDEISNGYIQQYNIPSERRK